MDTVWIVSDSSGPILGIFDNRVDAEALAQRGEWDVGEWELNQHFLNEQWVCEMDANGEPRTRSYLTNTEVRHGFKYPEGPPSEWTEPVVGLGGSEAGAIEYWRQEMVRLPADLHLKEIQLALERTHRFKLKAPLDVEWV